MSAACAVEDRVPQINAIETITKFLKVNRCLITCPTVRSTELLLSSTRVALKERP